MASLYFSKLTLNPAKATDRYAIHLAVSTAFGGRDLEPAVNRVLWRLVNARTLLVQSEKAPDWGPLLDDRFLTRPAEMKQVAIRLQAGQKYRFLLDGNPVARIAGKNMAIVDEEGQLRWLESRMEQNGMRLAEGGIAGRELLRLRKPDEQNVMTILRCRYEGVLEVERADLALDGLRKGIGRSKFAGMGMLEMYRVG